MTRNYVRDEVERMDWPEIISDPEGDALREMIALKQKLSFWRACACFSLAGLLTLLILLILLG